MDKAIAAGTIPNTYVFSDWFSVNQIPNTFDFKRHAYVSGIYDHGTFKGYELTVMRERNLPPTGPAILYRVHVEDSTEGVHSLSYDQAVQLLNDVGFVCKYEPKVKISSKVINTLKNLEGLGFTHIEKISKDQNVCAWYENKGPQSKTSLSDLPDFDYHDWDFITDDSPKLISGLLKILEEGTSTPNAAEESTPDSNSSESFQGSIN